LDLLEDEVPTLLLEVRAPEDPDLTPLDDLEEVFPDLMAPEERELLEELLPERTAPDDLELEDPDLTALDLLCELEDLLLVALGAEERLELLRFTADREELEEREVVAFDLL